MVDLSYTESDFGCKMIRNYYGSEHGKGESDGITGTIKTSIEMAVLSGPVLIRNAEDCYEYCKKNLTEVKNHAKDDYASESLRTFFLITDIDHTRNITETLNKVPGLRKLHSIVSQSQLRVNCRNLSCYCTNCMEENFTHFENQDYVHANQEKLNLNKGILL